MPVFWHFRVLFYLQNFSRPLIFDTLLGSKVNRVCNGFSAVRGPFKVGQKVGTKTIQCLSSQGAVLVAVRKYGMRESRDSSSQQDSLLTFLRNYKFQGLKCGRYCHSHSLKTILSSVLRKSCRKRKEHFDWVSRRRPMPPIVYFLFWLFRLNGPLALSFLYYKPHYCYP